jgi:hypothetical protein
MHKKNHVDRSCVLFQRLLLLPTIKPTPKAQPQYGGVLKIIETTGPKTPFGWPPEAVGEAVVAHRQEGHF